MKGSLIGEWKDKDLIAYGQTVYSALGWAIDGMRK